MEHVPASVRGAFMLGANIAHGVFEPGARPVFVRRPPRNPATSPGAIPHVAVGHPDGNAERAIGSVDAELRRIARDLHDTAAQTLAVVRVSLETALRARDECLGERVAETLPVLDAAIAQVRELICRLSPPLLEERGLTVALQWSFSRLPRPADIALELHADDNIGRLDPDIELACYRIAQEAVANAVRHAGAHRISVRIGRIGGAVHIDVCDDGHGVPEHVLRDGQPGFGLRAMRERAAEVGGRLEIASSAGRGTRVTAVLPIAEKDRR